MISIMPEQFLPEPFDRIDAAGKRRVELTAGQNLFLQGEATTGLYFLVSGAINLTRQSSKGHSIILHRASHGETFAEASLFSPVYHCSAVALSNCSVVEFLRTAIDARLMCDIDFARQLAKRFAMQIQAGRRHVELLSIRSAEDRILMAMQDGLLGEDISAFADLIGLAKETVYRMLKRLSRSGKIEKTARGQYRLVS